MLNPNKTEAILKAIEKVLISNNGYAFIGKDKEVAEALRQTGMVVRLTKNHFASLTHNAECIEYKAYTVKGWKAAHETSRHLESM